MRSVGLQHSWCFHNVRCLRNQTSAYVTVSRDFWLWGFMRRWGGGIKGKGKFIQSFNQHFRFNQIFGQPSKNSLNRVSHKTEFDII